MNRYRPDIDGLRTVAVLGVLFYHVGLTLLPGGFVGVDVFFVISGFLITRLIKDEADAGKFNFIRFYIRRVRRLFPAMLATAAVTFIAGFLLLSAEHFASLTASTIAAVFSVSNIWLWQESGYFDTQAITKPLLHTWSLSVEEQFYLFWPAALVFLLSARRMVAPLFIVLGGLASLYFAWAWPVRDPSAAFYLLPFRIYEFAVGALMVWLVRYQPRWNIASEMLLAIGLLAILWPMAFYTELTPFPSYTALLPCLGAALAIHSGISPLLGRLLSNRPMIWTGERSYSLYLVHWPIIVFWSYYKFAPLTLLDMAGIVILSFLAAYALHRLVEVPFRIRGKAAPLLANWTFGAVFAIATALVVLPSALSLDGLPSRIPTAISVGSVVRQDLTGMRYNDWATTEYAKSQDVGSFAPDARKILVIGDSHTAHFRALFDYIGKKYNLHATLWYYVGCNPLFGTTHVFPAPDPREAGCAEQNREWEAFVKTHRYDYVVLASRWAYTVEPPEYGPYTIQKNYIVDVNDPEPTLEASRRILVSHLHSTVEAILSTGAEAILFAQTPNNGKTLDGCDSVPRYLISDAQVQERCRVIDKSLALARQKFTNDAFKAEAAKNPRVHAMLPTDYLCADQSPTCRVFYDGIKLFQDETHLTIAGAKFVALGWEKSPDFPFRSDLVATEQSPPSP